MLRGLGALFFVGAVSSELRRARALPKRQPSGTGGDWQCAAVPFSQRLNVTTPNGGTGGMADVAGSPDSGQGGCRASDQCAMPFPYCLPSAGRCVECISTTNCAGTSGRYCDPASNTCVASAAQRRRVRCTRLPLYCAEKTAIGQCVECLSSDNCGSSSFACDRIDARVCPDLLKATPTAPLHPQRRLRDPASYVCVACVADDACPAATPHCDTRHP